MFVGLLAWAITQPPAIGVLILVTVGAGMAFPYFVLSALPEVARRFPRTGPWAELVKQMMGFLLLLAAVYFARPFIGRVVHGEKFWWLPFGVVVIAGVYLVIRTFEVSKLFAPRMVGILFALLLIGISLAGVVRLTQQPYQWTPFTDAALDSARASGRIVLVEFTADWCGNCQYVEAKVLHSREVVDAVRRHEVIMLKADVTRDDAPARPLLDQLNPAGSIPLTVIYSPRMDRPIELTGIYSKQDLQNALDLAAQPTATAVAAR
jgi:thiol:disulfide interchange protein DsbD